MEIILEISFLALTNTDVDFTKLEKSIWRFYITAKALPNTS